MVDAIEVFAWDIDDVRVQRSRRNDDGIELLT